MKILIIGGTGVISSQIVKQALKSNHEVTVVNRGSKTGGIDPSVKVITADRKDAAGFAEKLKDVTADVVIDMICFGKAEAEQTVEVFGSKAGQIIFTSSIAAYNRPYNSYPVCEDSETLLTCPDFSYAFNKAEMERYLNSRMNKIPAAITIIRPSLTFGDGSANVGVLRQNRNLVRRIKQGKPVVMIGEGVIPWSFTFTPDLANGFILACGNEKTYNDCFNVTNNEIVTWEDLYYAFGEVIGKKPEMAYIPTTLLKEVNPTVCEHLFYEKIHFSVFSIAKFQRAAPEYKPSVTLKEGIKSLVEWWEAADFPYNEERDALEDNLCKEYKSFRENLLKYKA